MFDEDGTQVSVTIPSHTLTLGPKFANSTARNSKLT